MNILVIRILKRQNNILKKNILSRKMIHVSMPPHFIHTSHAGTEWTRNIFTEKQTMMAAKDCITVISSFSFTLVTIYAASILCLPGLAYFLLVLHFLLSSAMFSFCRCCPAYSQESFYEIVGIFCGSGERTADCITIHRHNISLYYPCL